MLKEWHLFLAFVLSALSCLVISCSKQDISSPRNIQTRSDLASEHDRKIHLETKYSKLLSVEPFADILGKNLVANADGHLVKLNAYNIGKMETTTGKIIACDGFITSETPFTTTIPIGSYPVLIATAKFGKDERIAFSRLQFSEKPAVWWSMALLPDQDVSTLKPGEIFGYGVDTGTGAFIEEAALHELENEYRKDSENFGERIVQEMHKVYRPTRDWVKISTPKGSAVLFSSGFGDGFYASYFGYDAQDKPVTLMTDFNVVDWKPQLSKPTKPI